jgi:sucrose-6-phosphate hydrolase SacC (GH32 family)
VFTPGGAGAWDEILVSHTNVVPDPAGGYHLFYQGISRAQQDQCSVEGSCAFYTPGSIGHAFSLDGTAWTRDPAPVLVPEADDAFFVGGPSAVIRDGSVELFYFGIASRDDANNLRAHLARASATCTE